MADVVPYETFLEQQRQGAGIGSSQTYKESLQQLLRRRYVGRALILQQANQISPDLGDRARRILKNYPTLSPAGFAGMMELQDDPDSEVLAQIAALDADVSMRTLALERATASSPTANAEAGKGVQADSWSIADPLKGFTRTTFDVLSAPFRALQGGVRGAYGEISEEGDVAGAALQITGALLPPVAAIGELSGGYGDRPNPWEQTTFGQSIYAALGVPEEGGTWGNTRIGEEESVMGSAAQGDGWFVDEWGDDLIARRQRRSAERAAPLTAGGEAWTYGRGTGDALQWDPDSTRYRLVSGFIDAAAMLILDPLNLAGGIGIVGKSRSVAKATQEASAATVAARTAIAEGRKVPETAQARAEAMLADIRAGQARYVDLPAINAELAARRNEQRALNILADARRGEQRYGAVQQAGRLNTTSLADVDARIAETEQALQRALLAQDLMSREAKLAERGARATVEPVVPKALDERAASDAAAQVYVLKRDGAPAADRVEYLKAAFESGLDPDLVKATFQREGEWRANNNVWNRAYREYDRDLATRSLAEREQTIGAAQEAVAGISEAEVINAMSDLQTAVNLPGGVLYTPRNMPYSRTPSPVTPFTNPGDVFPAMVDGQPVLVRLPALESGAQVRVAERATTAAAAAPKTATHGLRAMGVIQTGKYKKIDTTTTLRLRPGEKPKRDLPLDEAEQIMASVTKAYDDQGNLVDITGWRIGELDGTGKTRNVQERPVATEGGTFEDFLSAQVKETTDLTPTAPTVSGPRKVRVTGVFSDMTPLGVQRAKERTRTGLVKLDIGDTVRLGEGGADWTVVRQSRQGNRVTIRSQGGQTRTVNRDRLTASGDTSDLNYTSLPYLEGTEGDVARLLDDVGDVGVGKMEDGSTIDDIPVDAYRVQVLDDDGNIIRTTIVRKGEPYEPSQTVTQVRGVVDATEPVPPGMWRDLLDTLPPAIDSPRGRTALADVAAAKGGADKVTLREVLDIAQRYEVTSELATVMMRHGIVGMSGLGRTKSQTWVPDLLGGSATPITYQTRRARGEYIPPPEVVQAQARQGRYAAQVRGTRDTLQRLKAERAGLVAEQAENARNTDRLYEAIEADRAAVRAKAEEVLNAERAVDEAGLTADELQAVADDLAASVKDVLLSRTLDGSPQTMDVAGVASLVNRVAGSTANAPVDRLLRRLGGEGMLTGLAKISNTNHLNRLFKGRMPKEMLEEFAAADTPEKVALVVQSLLGITPDTFTDLARSSRKAFVDARPQSMGDRVARGMEIVSARNPRVDLNAPNEAAVAVNAWLRTIGLGQDWIDARLDKFIRAVDPQERATILFRDIGDGVAEHLYTQAKVTDKTSDMAKAITKHSRIAQERFAEANGWFTQRVANGGHMNGMTVGDEFIEFGDSPHLLIELADTVIRLPDVAELRRLNTAFGRKIVNSPDQKTAMEAVVDWGNTLNDAWRTWLLVRGAYVVRNIAETQMRAYVMGSHNAFTNPLMFLGMVTSTSTSKPVQAMRPILEKFDRYNRLSPAIDMDYFKADVLSADDLTLGGEYANAAARAYNENVFGGGATQDFRAVSAVLNTHEPRLVTRGDPHFREGHARELLTLRADPFAKVVAGDYPPRVQKAIEAGTTPRDAILDWALNSDEGKALLTILDKTSKGKVKKKGLWFEREWLGGYLFDWPGSVSTRIRKATGEDEALLTFLRKGGLDGPDGKSLYSVNPMRTQTELARMSKEERARRIAQLDRDEESALAKAVSQVFDRKNLPDDAQFTAFVAKQDQARHMRRAADWFFNWSGRVERLAAWNPEFRVAYIRHSLRYLDSMHPEDAIAWLDAVTPSMPKVRALKDMPGTKLVGGRANFDGLYKHQRARLVDEGPKKNSTKAWLTQSDMESVAGAVASRHNKDLFYAAMNQGNFWHAARFAIPFGQPTVNAYRVFGRSVLDWKRVTTRHYPAVKVYQGAQSPGSSVVNETIAMLEPGSETAFTGLDENDMPVYNRPFLYREGEDQPLKFRFPFAGSTLGGVADALLPGDPGLSEQEMTGYVSGLNLALQGVQPLPEGQGVAADLGFAAANLLPSVGWTVQTAASWTPLDEQYGGMWDVVNRWLYPFGRPEDNVSDSFVNLLPTWAKRGFVGALGQGETSARWRATNMKGVMGWHATRDTGTNWLSPQGQEDLLARSDRDARVLTFLQALGAFFLPTAPQWTYEAIDKDGSAYAQMFLADEWRQIREKSPTWDDAVATFMDRHGDGVALVPGVTSSTAGEPTLSMAAWEALQANDQLNAYRQVLPFFYPGDISWTAYEWQRKQGYRESLSPQERIQEAHRLVYEMRDAALTARADSEGWADDLLEAEREALRDAFPTGRPKGTRQYLTSEEKLTLVKNAIADVPELGGSLVGQATEEALERLEFWTTVGGNKTLTGTTVAQERASFVREVNELFGPVPGGDEMRRLFISVVRER